MRRCGQRRLQEHAVANRAGVYLSVEGRLDDAIKAVRANSGKVLEEKTQIGPHGFRAVIVDSEGNPHCAAFIGAIDPSPAPQKIRGA